MKQMKFWLLHNQMSTAKQMRAATLNQMLIGLIFLSLKSSQLNSVILFVVFIKTTSIEWLAIVFFFFNSVAYLAAVHVAIA